MNLSDLYDADQLGPAVTSLVTVASHKYPFLEGSSRLEVCFDKYFSMVFASSDEGDVFISRAMLEGL